MLRSSVLLIVMLVFAACASLPLKTPTKLNFQLNYNEGMLPKSYGIYISKKKSYTAFYYYGKKYIFPFKVSRLDIKKLYTKFRDFNFANISIKQANIHDRGGNSLSLSFFNDKEYHSYSKSNSGQSYIAQSGRRSYSTLVNAIKELAFLKSGRSLKSLENEINSLLKKNN